MNDKYYIMLGSCLISNMARAKLKIKKVMKELKISQYELAKRLQRPERNVKRFLEGTDMKVSTLFEIKAGTRTQVLLNGNLMYFG